MASLSSAKVMQGVYEELKGRIGTNWVGLPKKAESVEKMSAYSRPGYREKIEYCHADLFSRDGKNFALLLGTNNDESVYYHKSYEKDISLLEFSDLWGIVNRLDAADPREHSIMHSTTSGTILVKVGGLLTGFQQFPFSELDREYTEKVPVVPTYENGQCKYKMEYEPGAVNRLADFIFRSGTLPIKAADQETIFVG